MRPVACTLPALCVGDTLLLLKLPLFGHCCAIDLLSFVKPVALGVFDGVRTTWPALKLLMGCPLAPKGCIHIHIHGLSLCC